VIPDDAIVRLRNHRVGLFDERSGAQLADVPNSPIPLPIAVGGAPDIQTDLCLHILLRFGLDMNHRAVGIHPQAQGGGRSPGAAGDHHLPMKQLQLLAEWQDCQRRR